MSLTGSYDLTDLADDAAIGTFYYAFYNETLRG